MAIRNYKGVRTSVSITLAVMLTIALGWMGRDLWLSTPREITCDDGARRLIDGREFATKYWAYAVEFEGSLSNQGKVAARLDPKQLQLMSEAMQQGREFRQFIVTGYNSCAIPKAQYAIYGARFQALDSVARQIDAVAGEEQQDSTRLKELVHQFLSLSRALAEG